MSNTGGGAGGSGVVPGLGGTTPGLGGGTVPGVGGGFVLPDASNGGASAIDAEFADAPACGLENFDLKKVPPEVLLVLDRSSSMNRRPVGGAATATLWTDALAAMDEVVRTTQAGVHWGLKMFPMPTGCMVANGAEVEVAVNNHMAVLGRATMTGYNNLAGGGSSGTPTDGAMNKAVAYLSARVATSPNPKYIVLATDGEPTCSEMPAVQPATAAVDAVKRATAAGFKTYVIGIAIEGGSGPGVLNQLAEAGGVPRNDPTTKYYAAANRADLAAALAVITGQVSNCVFPLSKPPPAPDSVKVTVDGMRVPQSMTDGWSYTSTDNRSITLHGSWCEKVKMQAAQVAIVFGCANIPIP